MCLSQKKKDKPNPFGAAKPREVVLATRGVKPEDDKPAAPAAVSSPPSGPAAHPRGPRGDHGNQQHRERNNDRDRDQHRGGDRGDRGDRVGRGDRNHHQGQNQRNNDRADRGGFGARSGGGRPGGKAGGDDGEWQQAGGSRRAPARKGVAPAKAVAGAGADTEDQGVVDVNAFNALGLDDQPDVPDTQDDAPEPEDSADAAAAPAKSTGKGPVALSIGSSEFPMCRLLTLVCCAVVLCPGKKGKGKGKQAAPSADDDDLADL